MQTVIKYVITTLFIFWWIPLVVSGQEYEKRTFISNRIETSPVIDGALDDEAWQAGEWGGDFIQYIPVEGSPSNQKTEFKIVYGNNDIFVAIKAYDSAPDSIISRLTRRDDIDGDEVGVIFDSYHDLKTGFCFYVSAAGVKKDFIYIDDGLSEDESFDPIWYTKTRLYPWGWSAEMRIPLTQLRFSKEEVQTWGFQVERTIYRHNETDLWQLVQRNASGTVHPLGNLAGIENIKSRTQMDLTPYGVVKAETYQGDADNPWADGSDLKANAGLDAKIGLSNNTILCLTVNPDFGQVEADPSEVNLTAFETFFTEKRPFFVESNNITDFNLGVGSGSIGNDNLFYSRRIGRTPRLSSNLAENEVSYVPITTPIMGAAKVTAKSAGGMSVGFIESLTAEVNHRIYNTVTKKKRYEVAEPMANYMVGRVQQDFNSGKIVVGGIVTNTTRFLDSNTENYFHKNATTGGLDYTQYFGNMKWMIRLRTSFSNINGSEEAIAFTQKSTIHNFARPGAGYVEYDPTRTSLTGTGGSLMAGKIGGNLQLLYLSAWKSPELELNDIGYMQVADRYLGVVVASYNIYKPHGIFLRNNFGTNLTHLLDFGGNLQMVAEAFFWNAYYKNLWETSIETQINSRQLSNIMLRGGPSMKLPGSVLVSAGFNTNERKKFVLEVNGEYKWGKENLYVESKYIGMELSYKPSNYLSFSAEPELQIDHNSLQYVTRAYYRNDAGQPRYILATIDQTILSLSLRVECNITPDLSVQYWGQPFISSVKYSGFKVASSDPSAANYSDRFHLFTERVGLFGPGELYYNSNDESYSVYEGSSTDPDYSFSKPDFSSNAFLSNLVLKWEFLPGSTAYLVWSQTREYVTGDGTFDMGNQVSDLFSRNKPYNVFLLKLSYRFGLR